MRNPRGLRVLPGKGMWLGAGVGALCALGPALALWGFTVDDALISARYAANLAGGLGYRFNAGGPVTDGVTPLGWAHALAPFAGGGPLAALAAAKVIGVVGWVMGAAALGAAVGRASGRALRFAALGLVAASAPLGAWSAAGMETGVVAALGALAAALPELGWRKAGAGCAGVAAGLRPELLPFALAMGVAGRWAGKETGAGAGTDTGTDTGADTDTDTGTDTDTDTDTGADTDTDTGAGTDTGARTGAVAGWRSWVAPLLLAALPFVAVAAIRTALFGRPAPLAAMAKPADIVLGARYAAACFLLTGPIALVAPLAWRRLRGWPRGLLVAVGVHFAAVAAAGGDWMPLSRLVVPALPAVVLAAAHVISAADARVGAARLALALAGELFAMVKVGPSAARVGEDRLRVIEELRGALSGARVVAALDIGWLGAATGATIVDLAGVTDPAIAALPGGHTTKRIPVGLLDGRRVDTVVVLLREGEALREPWTASRFARGVELYVASFPGVGEEFAPVAVSGGRVLRYVVLRRVGKGSAEP